MATLDEIRPHVCDDATELAAITGMTVPLLREFDRNDEAQKPLVFLRQHLARSLTLIVVRLHEAPYVRAKGTRVTASIQSLLEHACCEGRLSSTQAGDFNERRKGLISDYEARGECFKALLDFRHTELAHSVHLAAKSPAPLNFSPLWELAHDTFELVLDIENDLIQGGSARIVDLDGKFDQWRNRGDTFWSSRIA